MLRIMSQKTNYELIINRNSESPYIECDDRLKQMLLSSESSLLLVYNNNGVINRN